MPARAITLIAILLLGLVVGFIVGVALPGRPGELATITERKWVTLDRPLLVNGSSSMLPAGTELEVGKTYPEGFTRYHVIFNHKGRHLGEYKTTSPDYEIVNWLFEDEPERSGPLVVEPQDRGKPVPNLIWYTSEDIFSIWSEIPGTKVHISSPGSDTAIIVPRLPLEPKELLYLPRPQNRQSDTIIYSVRWGRGLEFKVSTDVQTPTVFRMRQDSSGAVHIATNEFMWVRE